MVLLYDNVGNRIKQHSECTKIDCPPIGANFGQPCPDGNPNTFNDRIRQDCTCKGDSLTSKILFNCPKDIEVTANMGNMGAIVNWSTPSVYSTFRSSELLNKNIDGFRPIGRFGNNEIYISNVEKNQEMAQKHCLANGGQLALISSMDENNFIQKQLGNNAALIGVRAYTKPGQFYTVDGMPLDFENWGATYPNDNQTIRQECVLMLGWAKGEWATCKREVEKLYIMQKPISRHHHQFIVGHIIA